jgi:hypothetical protein
MRHLLVLALAVAGAVIAAVAAQAEPVIPISTDACPGFAQTYPDDYLESPNLDFGSMPAGAYIAPGDDLGAITLRRLGGPNGIRWVISLRGLTAPGEGPNGSIDLPTLTAFASYSYTIHGEFTTPPGRIGGADHRRRLYPDRPLGRRTHVGARRHRRPRSRVECRHLERPLLARLKCSASRSARLPKRSSRSRKDLARGAAALTHMR